MRWISTGLLAVVFASGAPGADYEWVTYTWKFPWEGEAALFRKDVQVGSYSFEGAYYLPYDRDKDAWGKKTRPPVEAPQPLPPPPSALAECNAKRAGYGLPPFLEDPLLTVAAQRAAEYRAANLIPGHTPNDFACVPPGGHAASSGCAAWPPWMGWGSCCTEDVGYQFGGAAWVMGRDGQRYMHLYVR